MKSKTQKAFWALAAGSVPVILFANSGGPPIRRTGAAVDGGLDCTSACHASFGPANSDPRGRVLVDVRNYVPGVRQTIKVTVEHPEASRWGFQLTARQLRAESRQAGSFTPSAEILVRCDDGSERGSAPPCNGAVEFASHSSVSTRLDSRGRASWDIDWTPPSDDVGIIVFYAAGNAADNSGTSIGDRIYTASTQIINEGACALNRRPALRTAVNGASFQPGISMNALVSLLGLDFQAPGRSRAAARGDLVDGNFPKELACVAVEIAGQRVPITYVQNDQINAQAPTTVLAGPVPVRVIVNPGRPNEMRSDLATVTLEEHSPAFFTFLPTSSIAALVGGTAVPVADPSKVPGGRPARPGEIVSLYGTGFGPTEPVFQAGEIPGRAAPLRDAFTVTIGGITLARQDIQYAGVAPGSISGLYQFDVRVPPVTPDGDVPVVIRIGGRETQKGATIPVRRE